MRLNLRQLFFMSLLSLPCSFPGVAQSASAGFFNRFFSSHSASETKENLEKERAKQKRLLSELRRTELAISDVVRSERELDRTLAANKEALLKMQRERKKQQQKLDLQRRGLSQQIRALYQWGRAPFLKMMLSPQPLSQWSRQWSYFGYLGQAQRRGLEQLQTTLRDLQKTERAIDQKQVHLNELMAQQHEKHQHLLSYQKTRQRWVEELAAHIQKLEQVVSMNEALASKQNDLDHLVDHLEKKSTELSANKPMVLPQPHTEQYAGLKARHFKQLKGRLAWPTHGVLKPQAPIIGRYGRVRTHGILIAAPSGDAVRAVYPGRVIFANWLTGLGLMIIVQHDQGYMTLYGHNQSLFKQVGEHVSAGDLLAIVGNSGGQRQSGLYFEIRHRGRPLDPLRWCVAPKGSVRRV